jgi:hypothetical protein
MKNLVLVSWSKVRGFILKVGINGILAIAIWLSPSWLSFFIPSLKPFAVKWLALVVSPVVPSWAAVPILTILIALLRKGVAWLYRWIKDQITKLKYGAELFTLAGPKMLELILIKLRVMHQLKVERTLEFKKALNEELERLIVDNWETTTEEAEHGYKGDSKSKRD